MKNFTFKSILVFSLVALFSATKSSAQTNLYAAEGSADILSYTVNPVTGAIIAGPTNFVTPITSTAALAKNQITASDAFGCIYYLNRTSGVNPATDGIVTIYAVRPDGTGNGSVGTIDMNGAGDNTSFSFVRLGFDPLGKGWILAGVGSNIYIASFLGKGTGVPGQLTAGDINTFGNISLTVAAPGVASEFSNGDLAFSGGGTMYALANVTGGQTYIYTLNSTVAPTTLTRKWTVQAAGTPPTTFPDAVNGLAFTTSGSLHFSTGSGLYFIDQATANTVSGTVQAALVPGSAGPGFTDLGSDKFPNNTTFPVRLISFSGSLRNDITTLSWETDNEVSFDHFDIERSSNASAYTAVGNKPSVGGNGRVTYQFTDNLSSVSGNTFYYRLKMVDKDGSYKYSNVILVRKDQKSIKGLFLNPNPVFPGGMATARFSASSNSTVTFRVVDLSGKTLLQQTNNVYEGTNSVSINNLDHLQPGMYFLQMDDGAGVLNYKFSISR